MTGGSNIVRLGEQQAREALHTAIRQACITAKISPSQIRAVCIGAAGAGRPETAAKIRGILEELIPGIPREKIEVAGDAVIALEAAFGAGSGVIAIAGTGSIVYGRDATGNVARAGGWGFAISDEGSGHWIGRRAIALAMTARDEGLETALTDGILQAWKFNTIDELVQQANATPPPDFPRLFRTVLLAADGGDAIARELLIDAGTKLAALAAIVVRRLAPAAPLTIAALPIAMTGSVFRQSHQVRQIFYDTLQKNFPGIDVRPDLVDPVEGALARAKRL
jgi:N-acetylglucosamine kinase-like BadF-type ATPase